MKRIICAAIEYPETILCGLRHNEIINTYYHLTGKKTLTKYEQGFVTNEGDFVGRQEAMLIAIKSGQVKSDLIAPHLGLDSSDLLK